MGKWKERLQGRGLLDRAISYQLSAIRGAGRHPDDGEHP
jgi:hypothetical protein